MRVSGLVLPWALSLGVCSPPGLQPVPVPVRPSPWIQHPSGVVPRSQLESRVDYRSTSFRTWLTLLSATSLSPRPLICLFIALLPIIRSNAWVQGLF